MSAPERINSCEINFLSWDTMQILLNFFIWYCGNDDTAIIPVYVDLCMQDAKEEKRKMERCKEGSDDYIAAQS